MSDQLHEDGRERVAAVRDDGPERAGRISILVNRMLVEVDGTETNHAQLVALAHPGVVTTETRAFTVAFSRGGPSRPKGFVPPGGNVALVDRQEVYVAVADRSRARPRPRGQIP